MLVTLNRYHLPADTHQAVDLVSFESQVVDFYKSFYLLLVLQFHHIDYAFTVQECPKDDSNINQIKWILSKSFFWQPEKLVFCDIFHGQSIERCFSYYLRRDSLNDDDYLCQVLSFSTSTNKFLFDLSLEFE